MKHPSRKSRASRARTLGRTVRWSVFGAIACGGWFGCNALVGIDEAVLGGSTDGGDDTTAVDAGGSGDGGDGGSGDAQVVTAMTCTFPSPPLLLGDLKAQPPGLQHFDISGDGLGVATNGGSNGVSRVVVGHNLPGVNAYEYLVYNADLAGKPPPQLPQAVSIGSQERREQVFADRSGISILTAINPPDAGTTLRVASVQQVGVPIWFSIMQGLPFSNQGVRAGFLPLPSGGGSGPGDYYAIATVSSSGGTTGPGFVGRGSQSALVNGTPLGQIPDSRFSLFHIGSNIYAFEAKDGPGGGAATGYKLPDDGGAVGVVKKTVPTLTNTQTILLDLHPSVNAANAGKNTAFVAQLTLDSQSNISISLLRGLINTTDLDNFQFSVPVLQQGLTLDAKSVPADNGSHISFDDDVVLIGGPGTNSSVFTGLNFVWLGATGPVKFLAAGPSALMANRGNNMVAAGIAVTNSSPLGANFVVAWVERVQPADSGPEYHAIYANSLECQQK